jgi:hypothetical protein
MTASAASPTIPTLQTTGLPQGPGPLGAPPTPHMNSGRRLSKSVLAADSQNIEESKAWGMVSVRGHDGREQAVRVVQKAEAEDWNMIKITWQWFDAAFNKSYLVELRHGRRSGIRKIYVNKELVHREKKLMNMIADGGSTDGFALENGQDATINVMPKGVYGFTYTLEINGAPIEQQASPNVDKEQQLDIGVRAVQLPKTGEGLGITLRNNPLGGMGCVVWSVEPGKAAEACGVQIGDVVLSIEDHLISSIDMLTTYVAESVDIVNMELAGTGPSRVVEMRKKIPGVDEKIPIGLGLQTTSCGVGILINEVDKKSCADVCGQLKEGDCILSINGQVPSSPKDAVRMIVDKEYSTVTFVLTDSSTKLG